MNNINPVLLFFISMVLFPFNTFSVSYDENPYGIEEEIIYDYETYQQEDLSYYAIGQMTIKIIASDFIPMRLEKSSWERYQKYGQIFWQLRIPIEEFNEEGYFTRTFQNIRPDTFFRLTYQEYDNATDSYERIEVFFINSSDYLSEEDYKLVFPDDINGIEAIDSETLDIIVHEGQICVEGATGSSNRLEIYNANGALVMKADGSNTVDISSLPNGLYIALAQSSSQSVTKKFLR